MSLKMFMWQVHPTFLGVAQANSVAEARHALLCSDLGESGDGSCPERDAARQFILEHTPTIWYDVNAEFVLSDSAQLREQEQYSRILEARVAALEANLAAAREEIARIQGERDRALEELQEMDQQWRHVDIGPKGEWFMGRLKDGTEKALRRLPDGSSYEYSDIHETYYSWYWLTHWRPLTVPEQSVIDAARAGGTR